MYGTIYGSYKSIWVRNDFFLHQSDNFWEFNEKTGVLRKNIWFFLPILKTKFGPPPKAKNALVHIF